MRRILVGYDASDGARRALDRASAEAQAGGHSKVTVVAIAEMPLDPTVSRYFGTPGDISAREGRPLDAPPEVVAHLEEARATLATAGIAADLSWAAGEPGRAIVDAARAVRADVIIVGEHHHGFLGTLFGADVAAEVKREAGCDVIVA
jgi:nucleotide-binding universal stress UspA family protein